MVTNGSLHSSDARKKSVCHREARPLFAHGAFAVVKKILILTAGFGEGHNAAARGLRDGLEAIAPGEVEVEVLDLFERCYGRANLLAKKAYLATINQAPRLWARCYRLLDTTCVLERSLGALSRARVSLENILSVKKPHAVVSTYPVYGFLIDRIFAGKNVRGFFQATIVTDSITVNSVWHRPSCDCFVVANEETAEVMRRAGVPREKIRVLGFPVTPRFASNDGSRQPPSDAGGHRVLFMINFAKEQAPDLVRRLIRIPKIDLAVTVGNDKKLRTRIEAVTAAAARPVEVYGWTDKMPDLMMRSHLLIGKAGGATVQETVAAKTPMIISQIVPGQEEGNAQLILDRECGMLAESHEQIARAVESAFENHAVLWQKWADNLADLSKPDAALQIARFILEACL